MTELGSVQLLAIAFGHDTDYEGRLLTELECLEADGFVRVLDLLFLGWDAAAGEAQALNYQRDHVGRLLVALGGFALDGGAGPVLVGSPAGGEPFGEARERLQEMVRRSRPDEAVALVLLEHVWARELKQAMREGGAVPLMEALLSEADLADIAGELEEAASLLDEQRDEGRVLLTPS